MTDIKDLIAKAVHDQWSIWQQYQSKMLGNLTLTGDVWLEWNRKAKIPFEMLTKEEKKSDYEIAEKVWIPMLCQWLKSKREELFIDTVTSEDCEMSGVREETFEALLQSLESQKTTGDKVET